MELSKKVKIALDETRILILGAQILLGFQFRGVFSDGYEQLPTHARYLDGLARYAAQMKCELKVAIYWARSNVWSLVPPADA